MDEMSTEPQELAPTECPACGTEAPLRIAYGYPSGEMLEASERGEVALGGCVVEPDSSTWECRACGHRWGGSPSWIDGLAAYFSDTTKVRLDGRS